MAVVETLPAAEDDLFEIWDYIAADKVSPADELIRRFDEAFFLLAENPEAGRSRDELEPGLRSFPLGNFVIFYRPLSNRKGVQIVRILRASRDIPNLFES